MITGDYPATARAIAPPGGPRRRATSSPAKSSSSLSEAELAERVRTATVFARIMPEQKLRIVNALKANGEIVAMTGDGVNDAPSLKAAHIGIAMGGRGTDVAREASSIVLLDDDFGSIVTAVRLGRRIYDNLRKAMGFIFAVHVPIAGLALLPLAVRLADPVRPDAHRVPGDGDRSGVLARLRGRDRGGRRDAPAAAAPDEPLFSRALIGWSLAAGGARVRARCGHLRRRAPSAACRSPKCGRWPSSRWCVTIVSLIFVNRSFSASLVTAFRPAKSDARVGARLPSRRCWPDLALAVRGGLFRFGPLHADDLAVTLGAGFTVLVALEMLKLLLRPKLQSRTERGPPLAMDQTPKPTAR